MPSSGVSKHVTLDPQLNDYEGTIDGSTMAENEHGSSATASSGPCGATSGAKQSLLGLCYVPRMTPPYEVSSSHVEAYWYQRSSSPHRSRRPH